MAAELLAASSRRPEAALRPVHLHGILAAHGGAARVMRLVGEGVRPYGFTAQASCEVRDSAEPDVWEISPAELAMRLAPDCLCHAHGSRDWTELLLSFSTLKRRALVLTLHDCALLAGGCIHPGGCPGWLEGCSDHCPQGFPQAFARQSALREALAAQKPHLVSPSAWLRKMVRRALPGLKCELIPNGVEDPLRSTNRERARASFGLNPGAKLLLFAAHGGMLAANKGGRDFLTIWEKIKTEIPGAAAFIVGGAKLFREGDVYYWPYVDALKMQSFMLAADVFVNASPAENHSLLILEAMAAGVPVCAYKTGGIPEQVIDGETGLLTPLGDVTALGEAACELLAGPARARDMGVKARARYERNFRSEIMSKAYSRLYADLLA